MIENPVVIDSLWNRSYGSTFDENEYIVHYKVNFEIYTDGLTEDQELEFINKAFWLACEANDQPYSIGDCSFDDEPHYIGDTKIVEKMVQ